MSDQDKSDTSSPETDPAEILTDIPGVGPAYAEYLINSGFTSVPDVADAKIAEVAVSNGIDTETAECIRLAAREVRGDADTAIARVAKDCGIERAAVLDAYRSIVPLSGTLSDKITALQEAFSNNHSILALDKHSIYHLYLLHMNGFDDIHSVAMAAIEDLTEVPYITHQAEDIRDTARNTIGYREPKTVDEESRESDDAGYVCETCDEEFKFESVHRKHTYSCDDGVYYCDKCNEKFQVESTHKKHIDNCGEKSRESDDEGYVCETCGAQFKFEAVHRKHTYSCTEHAADSISVATDRTVGFTNSVLAELDTAESETPETAGAVKALDDLQQALKAKLGGSAWFQRYVWEDSFKTPYIGPSNATKSDYIWLGFVHEYYDELPRASNALQIEFGVDGNSASGFLGQEVLWGILLGPWADDSVVKPIKKNLREYSHVFAQFMATNNEYILVTKEKTLETPSEEQIESVAAEINKGFALTLKFELRDLPNVNILRTTCQTFSKLVPLYRLLAGINDGTSVTLPSEVMQETSDDPLPSTEEWDVDRLTKATTLNASQIQSCIDTLVSEGCSQNNAIGYVQRYLREMLQGEGLFAVNQVGPSSGRSLAESGVETIEELIAADLQELARSTDLSRERLQQFRDAAQNDQFSSLHPGESEVAQQLLSSDEYHSSGGSTDTRVREIGIGNEEPEGGPSENSGTQEHSENGADSSDLMSGEWLADREIPAPDELSVPGEEMGTTIDNVEVTPNHLTEYYEAFRNVRKVLQLVFQMDGIDIDPDNRHDPRVQYFILLDACIGFSNLSAQFTGYGQQHQDRLPFTVDDYYETFGEGRTVTEYQAINVEPFAEETSELLRRKTHVDSSTEFFRPCVPGTEIPLPELPGSFQELQEAMTLLSYFPAYPPLQIENGVSDRTIPIAKIYRTYFGELDQEHRVDLTPFNTAQESPPTGPVTDATPTSDTEAESKLLEYGRLSHLFRRVNPPAESPMKRRLGVLALDWYRPKSPRFNALQALAKHGENEPVEVFRPRLQDLIHRRFLLDDWKYDYITVFPGHEANSLSPQLVELAQDAVLETEILYTPLLERTETVDRQRTRSEAERKEMAIDPSASLRARARLNGETIILLDDICTTGSSLLAGAHLLHQAGAKRVVCLTLGLTPGGPRDHDVEITDPEAVVSDIMAGVANE